MKNRLYATCVRSAMLDGIKTMAIKDNVKRPVHGQIDVNIRCRLRNENIREIIRVSIVMV